eukprot:gene18883-biopygen914
MATESPSAERLALPPVTIPKCPRQSGVFPLRGEACPPPGRDGSGRAPHDRRTRTGRGPDAGRTIEFEEADADRTRTGRGRGRFSLWVLPLLCQHLARCFPHGNGQSRRTAMPLVLPVPENGLLQPASPTLTRGGVGGGGESIRWADAGVCPLYSVHGAR